MTQTPSPSTPIRSVDPLDLPADDPRRPFAASVRTAGEVIAGMAGTHRSAPTPCADWDAETLARHEVAVLRRVAAVGRGEDWQTTPHVALDVDADDLAHAWSEAADDVQEVFADPSLLSTPLILPFGTLPGGAALAVYTAEFSIHTWDLATATGQQVAWDPSALEVGLEAVRFGVPAEGRGPDMPFDPVVDVGDDAPMIDQLVAWMGRDPRLTA